MWQLANRNAGLVGSDAQEVALGSGSGLTADGPKPKKRKWRWNVAARLARELAC
jgi:hypothetical protein